MDLLDEEILNLFKVLNAHSVVYIMVGGFATNLHDFSRTTADLNIWIKDERANLVNFRNALKEFELGDHDYIINGPIITGWTTVQLISGIELYIMTDIKGINKEDYDLIYSNSPEALIESVSVKFLHLNQLIQTKEASNRPKDQVDLQELRKIREEKEQNTY